MSTRIFHNLSYARGVVMNRLFPLTAILVSVWLLLIVSSFLILKLLFQLPRAYGGLNNILLEILRVGAGVFMFIIWLILWKYGTTKYFTRAMKKRGRRLE